MFSLLFAVSAVHRGKGGRHAREGGKGDLSRSPKFPFGGKTEGGGGGEGESKKAHCTEGAPEKSF